MGLLLLRYYIHLYGKIYFYFCSNFRYGTSIAKVLYPSVWKNIFLFISVILQIKSMAIKCLQLGDIQT